MCECCLYVRYPCHCVCTQPPRHAVALQIVKQLGVRSGTDWFTGAVQFSSPLCTARGSRTYARLIPFTALPRFTQTRFQVVRVLQRLRCVSRQCWFVAVRSAAACGINDAVLRRNASCCRAGTCMNCTCSAKLTKRHQRFLFFLFFLSFILPPPSPQKGCACMPPSVVCVGGGRGSVCVSAMCVYVSARTWHC